MYSYLIIKSIGLATIQRILFVSSLYTGDKTQNFTHRVKQLHVWLTVKYLLWYYNYITIKEDDNLDGEPLPTHGLDGIPMTDEDIDGIPSENSVDTFIMLIILELLTVERDDVVQANTIAVEKIVKSKWELVDYGDDSDE